MSQQFSLFARMGKDLPLSILHELTCELKVSRVMTTEIATLPSTASMQEVKDILHSRHISGIPVVDGETLVGVISVEDLILALEQHALDAPVSRFMTSQVLTAHPEEPIFEALKQLERQGIGRLLVLDEDKKLAGILTKGDIMLGLLGALQQAYDSIERLGQERQPRYFFEALVSDETSLILSYHVRPNDFTHGGRASAQVKKALLQIGATPQLSRRVAIAAYEAEINLIIHTTDGGNLTAEIQPEKITVVAHDTGPGIADVELARQPGYTTASETAREMGFGAGMGLTNIKRCADEMHIWSAIGSGTRLEMIFYIPPEESA